MEHGQWLMTQSTNAAVALNLSAPARAVSVLTASTKLEDMPLAKLKQDMVDMEMALPLEAVDHDLDRSMWQVRCTR